MGSAVAGLVGATVEGSAAAAMAAAARVGAAEAATAVASILCRSHCSPSLTRNSLCLVVCHCLRRRRCCLGHKCMYLRTSIRLRPSPVEYEEQNWVGYEEGVGALPASALLSLPLGLLASVLLRY